MSDAVTTVGRLGAHDIGKEVILLHGDSRIRGVLRNIEHDIDIYTDQHVDGSHHTDYEVTTTLDIDGVIVYGVLPSTLVNMDTDL